MSVAAVVMGIEAGGVNGRLAAVTVDEGQGQELVYTCPDDVHVSTVMLNVCNMTGLGVGSGTEVYVDIWIGDGEVGSARMQIESQTPIQANGYLERTGLALYPGQSIILECHSTGPA